jgi:hypothetical protein
VNSGENQYQIPNVATAPRASAAMPNMRGARFAHCGKTCANEFSRIREVLVEV